MPALSSNQYQVWSDFTPAPVQVLSSTGNSPGLSVLRLDLIRSWATGNKYYKLKYAIETALVQGTATLVSKGGMFSNHLAVLAEACSIFNLHLVAVIRSYSPDEQNPSIRKLRDTGSDIIYLHPREYFSFDESAAGSLFPGAMFIPEGGLSDKGIRGAREIVAEISAYHPTHIIVSGGTLGTACGIVAAIGPDVKVIIVPAWKGCTDSYFYEILNRFSVTPVCIWELWPDYHFGGFGRFSPKLIEFISAFTSETGILLDPVYTAKMMYAIDDKMQSGYFKTTDSVLAIHTGGLQGLQGFRYRYPEEWGSYPS